MKAADHIWQGIVFAAFMGTVTAGNVRAESQLPIELWKKQGTSAQLVVDSTEKVPPGVLVVTYRLLIVKTGLQTPEMVVMSLSVVCDPNTNKPHKVFNGENTLLKLVGGKFVEDKVQRNSPPVDLPLNGDKDYGELPASAACAAGSAQIAR